MPTRRHEFIARDKSKGLSYADLHTIFSSEAYPDDQTTVRVEQGMRNQIKKLIIEVQDGSE